jgi:hypothetical protein
MSEAETPYQPWTREIQRAAMERLQAAVAPREGEERLQLSISARPRSLADRIRAEAEAAEASSLLETVRTEAEAPEPSAQTLAMRDEDDREVILVTWDEENGWQETGAMGFEIMAGLVTLGIGFLIWNLLRGALETTWADFPGPLGPDQDMITLSETAGTPGFLTVTMNAGPGIRWWKAAEIYDATGSGVLQGSAWTQDEITTNTTIVPTANVAGWFLVLKKAKAFGVHTSMYVIRDLASRAGRNITFTWTRD